MKRYVGIDVAQEQCARCIVDDAGTIWSEGTCPTDPDEIVCTINAEANGDSRRSYALEQYCDPRSVW